MAKARFERLPTGRYYGEIPPCRGVWAEGRTHPACGRELQEVLEDWLLLKLRDRDRIPAIGGFRLKPAA
jgi:predicted RNase H-like HicB family nuclease